MKICVKLEWKNPSPLWPPVLPDSPQMKKKLQHLKKALVTPLLVPCCQKLTLIIRDSDSSDVYTRGDVFVRLHDHSAIDGSNYMLAHHDVTTRGSFDIFPRGAILRGNQISDSLVMFKPNLRSPIEEGQALSRLYALHVDGAILGERVSSTTFIRFRHAPMPNLRRTQFHLLPSPRLLEPDFAICHRFQGAQVSLEIVEPLLPENNLGRQVWWHEDVQRHHQIPSGNCKQPEDEPTSMTMHSRRAFIRDVENRLTRTIDPIIVGNRYYFPFNE
jgi:hypothetical protein